MSAVGSRDFALDVDRDWGERALRQRLRRHSAVGLENQIPRPEGVEFRDGYGGDSENQQRT